MRSGEWIVSLYEQRRNSDTEKWRIEALLVRDLFNGEVFAPVTERLGQNEFAVEANNALVHMEQMVKRVCSTTPNLQFPAIKPGTKGSDDKARLRRLAGLGFWDMNKVDMKDRKRVRWMQSFGVGPMQIGIDTERNIPKWTTRDPLTVYSAPTNEDNGYVPDNVVFAYKRSFSWISQHYPGAALQLSQRLEQNNKPNLDTLFTIIEYMDAEERVLVLYHKDPAATGPTLIPNSTVIVLLRAVNPIGITPMVTPTTYHVDRIKSPYVNNVGMYIMRNKLAALEYIYAERSVFPETSFVEPPNSTNGEIVEYPNGREGILGHMRGGQLQTTTMQPNFTGTQMLDRLERSERVQNSTPADWGGESASNIRTNARGSKIVSEATDFTIQETQAILALAKEQELKIAIAWDKKVLNRPKSFYVGWKGNKTEVVDYKPSDIWENDEVHVYYPSAGTDANQFVISGGQRLAQQTLSKEAFMEMDPLVGDPELERDRIVYEQLQQSILAELLQPSDPANPNGLDPVAKARVSQLVKSNKMDVADAVMKVQEERQKLQATQDSQGQPTGVDPNSPEAQPGIGGPGAAAGIAGPSGDQQNLSQLLSTLRRPQMTAGLGA